MLLINKTLEIAVLQEMAITSLARLHSSDIYFTYFLIIQQNYDFYNIE